MTTLGRESRRGLFPVICLAIAASATAQTTVLTVAISPTGGGSVNVDPPGFDVMSSQSFAYDEGAIIALIASPNPGFVFDSWSGDILATGPIATLLMNMDRTVVANFSPISCTTTVPNVVGQSRIDAEDAIAAADLTVGTVTFVFSDSVPEGDVISQDPPGDTTANCDAPVDLVVSQGPEPCTTIVPDVEGLDVSDAQAAIVDANLTVESIMGEFSDTVPEGQVIQQEPPAGFNVECGIGVVLKVSLGPETCMTTVPDVGGLSVADATLAVQLADLFVEFVLEEFSDTVPAGQVIGTDPPAGFNVECGIGVTLIVSLGSIPCGTTVPDLTGLTQGEAETALGGASLTLGDVTGSFSPIVPAGQTISQDPGPGEEVDCGSPIDIVISLGQEPCTAIVPELGGLTQEEADFRLTLEGLELGMVRFVVNPDVLPGTIIDQAPLSGEQVACGSPVDIFIAVDEICRFSVPDLTGLQGEEAIEVAAAAGLDATLVPVFAPEGTPGTVVDQSIEPGLVAFCGTRIELGVYQEPPKNLCVEWLLDEGGRVLVTPPGGTEFVLRDDVDRDTPFFPAYSLTICPECGTFEWTFFDGTSIFGNVQVTVSDDSISFMGTDEEGRVFLMGRIFLNTGQGRAELFVPEQGLTLPMFDFNFRDSLPIPTLPNEPPMPPGHGPFVPPDPPPNPPGQPAPDPGPADRREFAFQPGTYVSVVALANPGYEFDRWSEPENGDLPFFTMAMDDDHIATARFRPSNREIFTLTAKPSPEGGGDVIVDPAGQLVLANDLGDCFRLSPTTGAFTLCLANVSTPGVTSALVPPQEVIETGFVEVERAGTVLRFDDIDGMGLNVCGAFSIADRAGFVTVFDPVSNASMTLVDEDTTDSVCDCDDTGEDEHAYMSGTKGQLSAFAIPGFVFGFWTGPVHDPFSPSTTFNIGQNANAFAFFLPQDAAPCMTTVPNVSGLSETDALTALETEKLNVGQVRMKSSDDVPIGHVISQGRPAGSMVRCGTRIDLVVSSGPQITVPNLKGLTLFQALAVLFANGLEGGTVTETDSETRPEGEVLSQSIKPGEKVDSGTKIDLVIAAVLNRCPVPFVTGLTLDEATTKLSDNTFGVEIVIRQHDDFVPAGSVIEQFPVDGTTVPCGSDILLIVSLGPCIVPDLTGLKTDSLELEIALSEAEVTLGETTEEFSDTVKKGRIIRQNPPAGQVVPCDSPVAIVVSKGPEKQK